MFQQTQLGNSFADICEYFCMEYSEEEAAQQAAMILNSWIQQGVFEKIVTFFSTS